MNHICSHIFYFILQASSHYHSHYCVFIPMFIFIIHYFFFLMIRRPPRSTQSRSSAASDVYKRQGTKKECEALYARDVIVVVGECQGEEVMLDAGSFKNATFSWDLNNDGVYELSLIHISEPTRPY
eukprot:TRINITY_DN1300_c0_g1_i1.p1 TRINITY_DN1300_c0_g1~~TRINITY_DN1300_c0_g1_i1.p1  ORF type:complete len:126 (-),score=32.21 TRINITY_DN1300_c0_g1_i1:86-463(-)